MLIKYLENQAGILQIILFLSENPSSKISDLINRARINQTAAYNSIEKLKDLGLIVESRDPSFPYARRYSLTEKGEKIALKLKEIEKVLQ